MASDESIILRIGAEEHHDTAEGAAMKPLKGIASLVFIALLAFSLAGCGFIAQKAVEQTTGVKVDQNGKSVTVTGKNGEKASVSSQEGKLPDGLPTDVPVYAGTIKASQTMSTEKGTNYIFSVETGDNITTIMAWYKKQLTDKGWTISSTVAGGTDSGMVQAKKGANNNIVATIGKDSSSGKTQIAVIDTVVK
jgi:hypothetical protein